MQSLSSRVHKLSLIPWLHAGSDWRGAVAEAWKEVEPLIPPSMRKAQVEESVWMATEGNDRMAVDGWEVLTPDDLKKVIHDLAVWLEGHEGV